MLGSDKGHVNTSDFEPIYSIRINTGICPPFRSQLPLFYVMHLLSGKQHYSELSVLTMQPLVENIMKLILPPPQPPIFANIQENRIDGGIGLLLEKEPKGGGIRMTEGCSFHSAKREKVQELKFNYLGE